MHIRFFLSLVLGCSDGGAVVVVVADAGSDDHVDVPPHEASVEAATFHAAPHPDAPEVVNLGGPVAIAPQVVPIFYADDPRQGDVESFLSLITSAPYWSATTAEYGVGPLAVHGSIVISDAPKATTTTPEIEGLLSGYLDGTHAMFPPPTLNEIYVVFEPAGTTISDAYGTSCVNYGAFHWYISGGASPIVYAVVPRCSTLGDLSELDALTSSLSHEIVEAVTDPIGTAWAQVDDAHFVWNLAPFGEVGDMCAYEPQSNARIVGPYVAQRSWSNAAARAGHDPCVPPLGAPYWNAAPILDDDVTLTANGGQVSTKGIAVPLGTSKTIDVALFSDGPTTDWTMSATDETYGTEPELSFAWDKETGTNGDTLHLTITRLANGPYGGSEVIFYADKDKSEWNMWFAFVGN